MSLEQQVLGDELVRVWQRASDRHAGRLKVPRLLPGPPFRARLVLEAGVEQRHDPRGKEKNAHNPWYSTGPEGTRYSI